MTATALAGLFRHREVVLPTWRGWLLVALLLSAAIAVFLHDAFDFLAPQTPRPGGALAMEGWVDNFVVHQAIAECQARHYTAVFATGQPMDPESPYRVYGTYADYGASRLHSLGLAEAVSVSGPDNVRDRTYGSASALRDWFRAHGGLPSDLTVLTQGPHARRSCLLYQKAFGPGTRVGVISAPAREYDPHRWWSSSAGFQEVMGEAIAYVYARLFFRAG